MGAIYHLDEPYSHSTIVDQSLSAYSHNPVRNSVLTPIIGWEMESAATTLAQESVSFTNDVISATSKLTLYSDMPDNKPVFWTAVSLSNHTVTYTFPALTQDQVGGHFYLHISNAEQAPPV